MGTFSLAEQLSDDSASLIKAAADICRQVTVHLTQLSRIYQRDIATMGPSPHILAQLQAALAMASQNATLVVDMVEILLDRADLSPEELGQLTALVAISSPRRGKNVENLVAERVKHLPLDEGIGLMAAEAMASSYRLTKLNEEISRLMTLAMRTTTALAAGQTGQVNCGAAS
ncbi:MAG: hypothetical protein HYU58_12835 [Proteobacteria bacterium]|nr:hypothetical protein [Pseudomonadota bacterium]